MTLTAIKHLAPGCAMRVLGSDDPYTFAHSKRTWNLVEKLGEETGLFVRYAKGSIRLGCLLHDVGKLGISREILLKPGRLTDEEFCAMRLHTVIGHGVIAAACNDRIVLDLIRHHHERLDGSGYPDHLAGDQIPEYVRVLMVCDCFDALISDRPYRNALSLDEALEILKTDAAEGKLDQATVDAFDILLRKGPIR